MTDRELDALVAVKVMGLLPCANEVGCIMGRMAIMGVHTHDGEEMRSFPQRYSTDIAAAWEVVGRMMNSSAFPKRGAQSGEDFQYWMNASQPIWWWSDPEDASRAICIAALKALGVEVDG